MTPPLLEGQPGRLPRDLCRPGTDYPFVARRLHRHDSEPDAARQNPILGLPVADRPATIRVSVVVSIGSSRLRLLVRHVVLVRHGPFMGVVTAGP